MAAHLKMHKTFLSRFEALLGGRQPYAWAKATGIGRGVIQSIKKGATPSGEALAAIGRTENCSLTWLLEGRGAPYLVRWASSDEDAADQLRTLLEERWDAAMFTGESGDEAVVVMTMPGQFEAAGGQEVNYTVVEVLAGDIGQLAIKQLGHPNVRSLRMTTVDERTLRNLAGGHIGTWELTRPGGLLERTDPRGGAAYALAERKLRAELQVAETGAGEGTRIPVHTLAQAAARFGRGKAEGAYQQQTLALDPELSRELKRPFGLVVEGSSLAPELRAGDRVIVDEDAHVEPGDLAAALVDDETRVVLGVFVDEGEGQFRLAPLNPSAAPYRVSPTRPGRLLGRVVQEIRRRRPP